MACLLTNTEAALEKNEAMVCYGAGCLGGGQLGTVWEEHWVLRDEEEVKEEEGRVTEKGMKPGQSSAQLTEGGVSVRPSGEGPAEEPLLWDPGCALDIALHFSGLSAFICENVTVIFSSRNNYGKNCTGVPHHAWHAGDQYTLVSYSLSESQK